MRKIKLICLIGALIGLSVLSTGCLEMFFQYGRDYNSALKSYNAGNYDRAVYLLVSSLKAKPDYDKSIALLNEVAPLAYEKHQKAAIKYEEDKNWDETFANYDAITKLVAAVSSLRGEYPTVDVESKRDKMAQRAAEEHYERGISFMNDERHKEAAIEFRTTQNFVPGYRDSQALYEEMRKLAVKRVAIMPFENKSGKTQFGDIGFLLADEVISDAMGMHPEFMEFVTRDYVKQILQEQRIGEVGIIDPSTASEVGKVVGLHAFVFGKVLAIITNYPSVTSIKESNTRTIYRSKEEGGPYDVSATWEVYSQTGSVEVTASFQIIDVKTGTIKKSRTITAEREDKVRWARHISGDRRALTYEAERLCMVEKRTPNPPEVLVSEAIRELARDLAAELVETFK